MSCIPGMPCYGSTPRGCGIDPCHAHKTGTDLVHYNGPNLPCSGIDTCDTLTLALQKMDTKICPEALAMSLLTALNSNPSLLNIFCNLVNGCIPVTTTTTTTTIIPCSPYNLTSPSFASVFNLKKCGEVARDYGMDANFTETLCLDNSYPVTIISGPGTISATSLSCTGQIRIVYAISGEATSLNNITGISGFSLPSPIIYGSQTVQYYTHSGNMINGSITINITNVEIGDSVRIYKGTNPTTGLLVPYTALTNGDNTFSSINFIASDSITIEFQNI